MRILSGIQPSGKLHIGNYLGMIKPMEEAQISSKLFCFIADMHSITTVSNGEQLRKNVNEAMIDLLALGIDPDKSILWVQSDVPEVTELAWYLSSQTPMGLLQRCHSYKDKVAKGINASHGLFAYPVLMAADILLYSSDVVPVGRDQKQHVEVTRDIAIKFNAQYGDIFTLPQPQINNDLSVIPGVDGLKMSKSYNNTIEIFAPQKKLRKKVMSIVTDSTPIDAPKNPDSNNVFNIYKLFATKNETDNMSNNFIAGDYGYGDAKKELYEKLLDYFADARKRREEIASDTTLITDIRKKGAQKARAIAAPLLDKVRSAIGIA